MQLDSKEAIRRRAQERQNRLRQDEQKRQEKLAAEQKVRDALSRRPPSVKDQVVRLTQQLTRFSMTVRGENQPGELRSGIDAALEARLIALLNTIADKAPRLIPVDPAPLGARQLFLRLAKVPWIRSLADWAPRGKGRDTVWRSLFEHLLAKYKMPGFLWSAFFIDSDATADPLVKFVVHVAAGGSVYEAVKTELISVPFTRKMCHEFTNLVGDMTMVEAIRKVQVKTFGGDGRMFRAWLATAHGRELNTRAEEEFWQTILAWFCQNPMLETGQIAPLVDYISYRRRQNATFSIKGRSVMAMLEGMAEWHAELAKAKVVNGSKNYAPSGFHEMDVDRSRTDSQNGQKIVEIWRVREILTAKALADEGRAMHHCVFSYAGSIENRQRSIWTLTKEDVTGNWRMLTIEVINSSRRIVQVRGLQNRRAVAQELAILSVWSSKNGLQTDNYSW